MSRPRSKRDENGWLIPQEGTAARHVYDLAVAGTFPQDIKRALPHLTKNYIEVLIWRIKHPDRVTAQQNKWRRRLSAERRAHDAAERLRNMVLVWHCTECLRPNVHDHTMDWAYWERYEDGSFICPTCRGVDPAEEHRKLLALP